MHFQSYISEICASCHYITADHRNVYSVSALTLAIRLRNRSPLPRSHPVWDQGQSGDSAHVYFDPELEQNFRSTQLHAVSPAIELAHFTDPRQFSAMAYPGYPPHGGPGYGAPPGGAVRLQCHCVYLIPHQLGRAADIAS